MLSAVEPEAGGPADSWRWLALLAGAVAAGLLVPFVLAGGAVDRWFAGFEDSTASSALIALVVVGLLSIDVVAPVPSSVVAALAGATLGPLPGAMVVFVGLSVGCLIGYLIGSAARSPMIEGRAGARALTAARSIQSRHGLLAVVLARPVPLLAEATVIVAGVTRVRPVAFAFACAGANAVVAALFAALPGALA